MKTTASWKRQSKVTQGEETANILPGCLWQQQTTSRHWMLMVEISTVLATLHKATHFIFIKPRDANTVNVFILQVMKLQ
jgi:hypothetical protein